MAADHIFAPREPLYTAPQARAAALIWDFLCRSVSWRFISFHPAGRESPQRADAERMENGGWRCAFFAILHPPSSLRLRVRARIIGTFYLLRRRCAADAPCAQLPLARCGGRRGNED